MWQALIKPGSPGFFIADNVDFLKITHLNLGSEILYA